MKSKRKNIPKYVTGGELALAPKLGQLGASGIQGLLGASQAIFGNRQYRRAKDLLDELQRNNPSLQVPTAFRRLANEPVAEEYMEAQEMGAQRRTSQAIDALGKGGSRTLGLLPSVLENERMGELQRAGQYEQERQNALRLLGAEEARVRDMNFNKYLGDLAAAQMSMDAGVQNIFGGAGQIGRGATSFFGNYTPSGSSQMTYGQVLPATQIPNLPLRGPSFEEGGVIKTKGVFSHRKNPKDLIDRNTGEVEAELTGDETVFNKKDSEMMERLANEGKDKELRKFVKGAYKKFRSKKKSK